MAQGFEIVQSVFPGWKFAPAETVIVNGLHGALLLAPRHPAGFGGATDWVSNLAGFEIELLRDGAVVDRGQAANVLDGPLSALRQLVGLLARDSGQSPVRNRRHRHHRHLDPRLSDLARGELEHDASRHRARRQACLVRMNRTSPRQQNAPTHRLARSGNPVIKGSWVRFAQARASAAWEGQKHARKGHSPKGCIVLIGR